VLGFCRRPAAGGGCQWQIRSADAIQYAKALTPYNLFWYEEAGDPLDYQLQAELGKHYAHSMATAKSLLDAGRRNLIRTAECGVTATGCNSIAPSPTDWWNTADACHAEENGWSRRAAFRTAASMSLNIAAGLGLGGNESYPDLFQPYGGFPDGVSVIDGHITMPDLVGLDLKAKPISTAR